MQDFYHQPYTSEHITNNQEGIAKKLDYVHEQIEKRYWFLLNEHVRRREYVDRACIYVEKIT